MGSSGRQKYGESHIGGGFCFCKGICNLGMRMHCLMYNLKRVLKLLGPENLIAALKG